MILQMELINECSMRFAEDKDFRLLVCGGLVLLNIVMSSFGYRLLTALWHVSERISLDEESSAKDSRKCVLAITVMMPETDKHRSWPR